MKCPDFSCDDMVSLSDVTDHVINVCVRKALKNGQLRKWKVESSQFNFKGGNGCLEVMLEMREKSLCYKEEAFHKNHEVSYISSIDIKVA